MHRGAPTTLPEGLAWCAEETRATVERRLRDRAIDDACEGGPTFCVEGAQVLAPCARHLYDEGPPQAFRARMVFGVSSDEAGALTELCLVSSDLGDTPQTLACVVEKTRAWKPRLAPNLRERAWRVDWIIDE